MTPYLIKPDEVERMKYCLVLAFLCIFARALPVRIDGEKKPGEAPAAPLGDIDEYKRYLDEIARNDPGENFVLWLQFNRTNYI